MKQTSEFFSRQVGTKGQITIPVELRRALGLRPGDILRFEMEGDTILVQRKPAGFSRWFGSVRHPEGKGFDDRELEEEIARAFFEEASS